MKDQPNSSALYTFYKQKYENTQIQISTKELSRQKLQNISISLKAVKKNLKNSYIISKNVQRGKLQNDNVQQKIQKNKLRCRTQILVNKHIGSTQLQLSSDKKCKFQVERIQHVFQTEVANLEQGPKAKYYSRNYEQVMLLAKCLPLKKTQKFKQKNIVYEPYELLKKKSIDQKRLKVKSTLSKQRSETDTSNNKIVVEWKSMTRQNSSILQMIKCQQKNDKQVQHKIHLQRQKNPKFLSNKSLKLAPIQRSKSILFRLKMNKRAKESSLIQKKNKSLQKLFLINDTALSCPWTQNKTMQLNANIIEINKLNK